MENYNYQNSEDQFSLKKEIQKYSIHWKWFLISGLLASLLAVVYLKTSNSIYNAITTILIKDSKEGRGLSELAAFQDFSSLGGANNDIDDEIDIIKSKTLLNKVVEKLKLNISQQSKKGFKMVDIYGESPIDINFERHEIVNPLAINNDEEENEFSIIILSNDEFSLFYSISEETKKYNFGQKINLEHGILTISKSSLFQYNLLSEEPVKEINIKISSIDESTFGLQKIIRSNPKSKRSSLIDLSMQSSNRKKAKDILNNLVEQYNKEAVDDKNLISLNTAKFIDERLQIISKELESVESKKTSFKKNNKLTDIKAESELFIDQVGDSQKRMANIQNQLELINSMIKYLSNTDRETDLLPANIGLESISINTSIVEFNRLVLNRDRLLGSSTKLNPLVQNLNSDINSRKINLLESLKNQRRNILITKKDFNKQQSKLNSKIASIPAIEKDFRDIERQQSIKETLYVFLLKKREETSISMAVTAPVAKIIDSAYCSNIPVAPKKKIILLAALLLGMLIPFGIIYVKDLLDTKISEKADIEKVLNDVPVLVEIGKVKRGESDVLKINDRSVLGESFRILRTNLNYLIKNKKKEGKATRVFVTSTIKGEGKTFVSFNTVLSLLDSNKKILVVGGDIRNPQLHRYLKNDKNSLGLSEYLYDKELKLENVLNTLDYNNNSIDYVTSGRIPPNPSELLMNGRLENLLNEAEDQYDYIIVDTAPTMLVTDTLLICESADVTIYVIRANYTEKELLNYSKGLHKDGKINNMAIVLNDVKSEKIGYGYSYGYGDKKKSFFEKLFKR